MIKQNDEKNNDTTSNYEFNAYICSHHDDTSYHPTSSMFEDNKDDGNKNGNEPCHTSISKLN